MLAFACVCVCVCVCVHSDSKLNKLLYQSIDKTFKKIKQNILVKSDRGALEGCVKYVKISRNTP